MSKIRVRRDALPAPEQIIRNDVLALKAAREAHRSTVGVPAPMPQFDISYQLAEFDEIEVFEPPREQLGDPDSFKQALDRMTAEFAALKDEVVKFKAGVEDYKGQAARLVAIQHELRERIDALEARAKQAAR